MDFSLLLISKSIFSLSFFFFGRKPSNVNLEEWNPLETRAVIAAQGPGIQIIFSLFDFTSFTRLSPGSQILGIPASLTNAIDSPFFKEATILGIFFSELWTLFFLFVLYLRKL